MTTSILRTTGIGVLWAVGLVPVVLWLVHLSSPELAVQLAIAGRGALGWLLLGGGLAGGVAMVAYPPFLPSLRLAVSRLRLRMSTDVAPLREAQGRLQHLETAADHLTAGRILRQLGRAPDALSHLQRAVELDPEHAASRYQLGLALLHVGQPELAAAQLAATVQRDAGHAFGAAKLELGIALQRAGHLQEALAILDEQQRMYGESRRAQFHRAKALRGLSRDGEATDALRSVAKPPAGGTRLAAEDALLRARAVLALRTQGAVG